MPPRPRCSPVLAAHGVCRPWVRAETIPLALSYACLPIPALAYLRTHVHPPAPAHLYTHAHVHVHTSAHTHMYVHVHAHTRARNLHARRARALRRQYSEKFPQKMGCDSDLSTVLKNNIYEISVGRPDHVNTLNPLSCPHNHIFYRISIGNIEVVGFAALFWDRSTRRKPLETPLQHPPSVFCYSSAAGP